MPDPSLARQIRVFISSTFTDMKADREYLVKFTFPQLRKLCESRGVTWGEVDFRWGVTDEQKAEGKVLPIVLAEIENCQPFFIGLLGERYGQVYRDEIPVELAEQFPWLEQHRDTSLTELEILQGVLNSKELSDHAFFYFRDPQYATAKPGAEKADFVSEAPADREKLATLKDRIRQRHRDNRLKYAPRENYANPEALGKLVLTDFTRVINDLFPEGSQPDPLDREAMDHEVYAQSRERVYIGRQEYFDRLNTHAMAKDGQPLVILGESGCGKSALLANWVARYRRAHPDILVLQHYIGATPYSADWAAMLRRLMGELKRKLGIQQEIHDQPDALRSAFPNWLYMAAAKGRVVLVLDALNQLEDRDGAPDLVWLPPVLPDNVRLIVSTLPGRSLDEIHKRDWLTLKVELLSPVERRTFIAEYLAQHSKSLSTERAERIAAAPQSANPLFLRVLLDELRVIRTHEELDQRISDYLKAGSPYELYGKVIIRWEEDYEGDSDLVGDTLSLLWAARRGLTEAELLQALGRDGVPLTYAKWSPLYLAISDSLVSRGGLLVFAHDFLRTATRDAYIPSEFGQQQAHIQLADYFERQPGSSRRTDELPWQLAEAQEWQCLYDLVSSQVFFVSAWKINQFEVKACWSRIESNSSLRMVEAYRKQIERPETEDDKNYLWSLGSLLEGAGYPEESLRIRTTLVQYFRDAGEFDNLAIGLGGQALALSARGDLDAAMALHKEKEQICRQLNYLEGLAISLGNQALILNARGDLDGAMALHKEQERICRQLGNLDGLSYSLGNQANILYARGDLDGAMALHEEDERICRQLGNLDGLEATLGNKSAVFYARGDLDGAMALLKDQERICRQLGNQDGLQCSLGNQALILTARGDLDGATALHEEEERICRKLGNLESLQRSLGNQAQIFTARGDLDGAMALHEEEERICRQLGNLDGLQGSLGNQALIFEAHGDLDGAMALHKEKERICQQMGNIRGLAYSLANQAWTLEKLGRAREGLPLAEEAYRLATSHGYAGIARQIVPNLNRMREAAKRG